jgi:hypothetical protein
MPHLTLIEYRTVPGVRLSREQRDAHRRVAPSVRDFPRFPRLLGSKSNSRASEPPTVHANPSRLGGVVGVTQSTESRCINGGIGD